jgi:hypothetical protein
LFPRPSRALSPPAWAGADKRRDDKVAIARNWIAAAGS